MNDNKIKCMCSFSLSKFLANVEKTRFTEILTDKCEIDFHDLIMTIWFNENVVDIFNLDYYMVKYLPVFIADFDLSLEQVFDIYNELNEYVMWYEETVEIWQDINLLSDKDYFNLCKSMREEIKKQWL